jgi:hypothetical protein
MAIVTMCNWCVANGHEIVILSSVGNICSLNICLILDVWCIRPWF